VGIRLRWVGWRSQHREPKALCQFVVELSGEDRVAIMNEKPVSMLVWDRLPKLLRSPFCRGVGRHIAVQNPPRTQFQNNEHIKKLETSDHRHQEVAGNYHVSRDCARRSSMVSDFNN
jgi:hypothetical protein